MHTGKSYTLGEFLLWTRHKTYVLIVLSVVPVALYELAGWHWLAIPWGIVFMLGTTVALSAGFKNLQTYNRMQDAQQVWSSIASSSRIWGVMCRDLVGDPVRASALVYRHLAWLAALRHEMRRGKAWETSDKVYNVEYRRHYSIPEREQSLGSELKRFVSPEEASRVLASHNAPLQVLALQSSETRALLTGGAITPGGFSDLQKLLRDLQDLQGRSERIKNFPYPRQQAFINTLFVRILCVLLPLGMIGEFVRVSSVWFAIPLSLLIAWMYTALDQVGESTENPFKGRANDVPISGIRQEIETDLRELLGETRVPSPTQAAANIAM